jgi:hypothetical protein
VDVSCLFQSRVGAVCLGLRVDRRNCDEVGLSMLMNGASYRCVWGVRENVQAVGDWLRYRYI